MTGCRTPLLSNLSLSVYLYSSVAYPTAQTILSDWMSKKLRLELEMDEDGNQEEEEEEKEEEEQPANLNYRNFHGTDLFNM